MNHFLNFSIPNIPYKARKFSIYFIILKKIGMPLCLSGKVNEMEKDALCKRLENERNGMVY